MKVAANARSISLKLERKAMSLVSRSKIYMEMMKTYKKYGASDIVIHISKDLERVKKVAERLLWLSRVLEWIALRAETLAIAGFAYQNLANIVGVLREIKKDIICTIPEISIMINEVEKPLEKACSYVIFDVEGSTSTLFTPSKEALEILKKAEEIAKSRLEESLKGESLKSS